MNKLMCQFLGTPEPPEPLAPVTYNNSGQVQWTSELDRVVRKMAKTHTIRQIALATGLGWNSVKNYCAKHNIPTRGKQCHSPD